MREGKDRFEDECWPVTSDRSIARAFEKVVETLFRY